MQTGQIKDRLMKIEQYVNQAARACELSRDVPDDLRDALGELERASDEAKQLVEVETAEDRFVRCVDRLEAIGDRAMRSCNDARIVDQKVQTALTRAHDMLSTLKHELQ